MKNPLRRKLLWIATGFLHEDFPEDEEQFIKEESEGIIFETNVTTDYVTDDSDDDDNDEEMLLNINCDETTDFNMGTDILNNLSSNVNQMDPPKIIEHEIIEISSDED
uniref:Uncharacterized protein n=1 Tax=Panagrolaimus sp. PS1159 TaxID=55785 RepID=A0AC35GKX8_9BILA